MVQTHKKLPMISGRESIRHSLIIPNLVPGCDGNLWLDTILVIDDFTLSHFSKIFSVLFKLVLKYRGSGMYFDTCHTIGECTLSCMY